PGSVHKGAAHPVSVRIQAAGRVADRPRKSDSNREDALQPGGGGRKPSVEEKGILSPANRRRVGSANSEIHWGVSRSPFSKKRVKRPGYVKGGRQPMGTVLLSVGAALVLGTIMGFSVISLFFSDDPALSPRSIDSHLERNPSPEGDTASSKEQESVFSLADLNAVLLQGGSFAEKERAQQVIQSHRSKGRAGVMTDASPHRIFLGVAKNRDDALKLSVTYQKENVDVYLKDLKVKGDRVRLSKGTLQAVEQDLPRFVEDGHRIFQTLAASTTAFLGGSSSSFSDPKQLEEVHRRMMDAGARLEKQLPSGARPHLQDLMMAADQAVQSAREASRNPNAALVWQTQEGLVRYALAYEALISSLR
ncbi:MAG: hypothetical protein AB2404_15065, partial [Planifilum fimeticola]